ncbi:hypothetical protein MSAN_02291400 [Mycena sanguinolenta]|uniref:Uncharacterized protein n=1 Tax=Mycena sanguinolenta TaxID=230812 RepID=A0A8H6X9K5_9AGAR|nr:hypothetical protein MSAN_02291400 [Mycena sanguinolenta]
MLVVASTERDRTVTAAGQYVYMGALPRPRSLSPHQHGRTHIAPRPTHSGPLPRLTVLRSLPGPMGAARHAVGPRRRRGAAPPLASPRSAQMPPLRRDQLRSRPEPAACARPRPSLAHSGSPPSRVAPIWGLAHRSPAPPPRPPPSGRRAGGRAQGGAAIAPSQRARPQRALNARALNARALNVHASAESSYSAAEVVIAFSFRPADAARATEGLVTVSVDLFGGARPRGAELVPRARPSPRLPIEIARASATHSIGRPLSGILGVNISAWRQMNVARRRREDRGEVGVIAAMQCGHVASSASVLGGWALDIVTADVLARIKECIDRFELCVDEQGASHASGAELARVVSPNARVVDRY